MMFRLNAELVPGFCMIGGEVTIVEIRDDGANVAFEALGGFVVFLTGRDVVVAGGCVDVFL